MKLAHIAALAAFGLAVAAFAGISRPEPAQGLAAADDVNSITVNGMGSVAATPDQAEFSFGVVSQGTTARAALAANAAEMRRVIDALKGAGVAADDIQTQQVFLSPRTTDDGEAIVGYTAQNTVGAKVRDLAKSGAIIDAAVAAGANTVYGPALVRSDQTELYRTALRAAVADARSKAQALAAAGGVGLGRVVTVIEAGAGPQPLPVEERARAADSPATPIEPGTQRIEATATVTFAIS
ncbi:MAG: SIMPL domain-containing protein [Gaiellaceae bacterium]